MRPFTFGMSAICFVLGIALGMRFGIGSAVVAVPVGVILGLVGAEMDERMFT
jgi:hypothetical protein